MGWILVLSLCELLASGFIDSFINKPRPSVLDLHSYWISYKILLTWNDKTDIYQCFLYIYIIFKLCVLEDTHTKERVKETRKNRRKLNANQITLWCFKWKEKDSGVKDFILKVYKILSQYKFLPQHTLAAISHVQNIQFEAVVGHKPKVKWINELQPEMYTL